MCALGYGIDSVPERKRSVPFGTTCLFALQQWQVHQPCAGARYSQWAAADTQSNLSGLMQQQGESLPSSHFDTGQAGTEHIYMMTCLQPASFTNPQTIAQNFFS